jgi:Dolichyl-phosphate-mannose-protein mannosyltransferase
MLPNLASRGRNDPVYFMAIAVSTAAFILAISLIIARPIILSKLVIPLAVAYYSSDKVITQEGLDELNTLLIYMAPLALLIGCLAFGYAFIWRYLSARLPAGGKFAIQPSSIAPVSAVEICYLLATLAIALILRLHSLSRSLTSDEIFTAMHFVEVDSVWKVLSSYISFNNHIAYSILAWCSQSIFGRSEWAFRLPALLLGLASLYLFWVFVRSVLGSKIAIIATFALAISPSHVEWSVTGRGYSGMIFFTLLSTSKYLKLLERLSYRDSLVFITASVIGIYFHLYAAFVTIVQILFLLLFVRNQLRDQRFAVSHDLPIYKESFQLLWISLSAIILLVLICYAPVLPNLIFTIVKKGHGTFQPFFPFTVISELSGYTWGPLLIVSFTVFLLGLISLWKLDSKKASYFALLLLVPLGIVWITRPIYLFARFFTYFLPYYILLLSLGFVMLWDIAIRRYARVYRYLLCVLYITLVASIVYRWAENSWYDVSQHGFREAARDMAADTEQESAACAIGSGAELFQYYSEKNIFLPYDMNQLEHIMQKYPTVKCAYFDDSGNPREPFRYREMREFLVKNAEVKRYGYSLVFTHRTHRKEATVK